MAVDRDEQDLFLVLFIQPGLVLGGAKACLAPRKARGLPARMTVLPVAAAADAVAHLGEGKRFLPGDEVLNDLFCTVPGGREAKGGVKREENES